MNAHRAEARIDLAAIRHNYNHILSLANGAGIIAVVKANAYGHGAIRVARTLYGEGCRFFAVACLEEALQLREAGIEGEILILGVTPEENAPLLEKYNITQAVTDAEYAAALGARAKVSVHIKIDTGMSRLGIYCHAQSDLPNAIDAARAVFAAKNITVKGIFTHFAESDDKSSGTTERQYSLFCAVCDALRSHGLDIGIRHCCNSAAILAYPEMHLDMVRPGIILYGHAPSPQLRDPALIPAMSVICRVYSVKQLHKDDRISYGGCFTAPCDMNIAVISIGYADGFSRVLSGSAKVTVNGVSCPVVGRICMDLCMVDISDAPNVKRGDIAVIFDSPDSVDALAATMGTINYEVLCMFRQRVTLTYGED